MPRFFCRITRFPGAVIDDTPSVAHLRKALRKRVGDELDVRVGEQGYLARITGLGPTEATLELIEEVTLHDRTHKVIHLALCLFDLREWEWALRSVVELGVSHVHPLVSERSQVRSVTHARKERWRLIALEAVKQCGRRSVPVLHDPQGLKDFAEQVSRDWEWRFVAVRGAHDPLAPALGREGGIVIGPEGGLTDDEMETLKRAGFRAAGMGDTTLRSFTAAVAAMAILGQQVQSG